MISWPLYNVNIDRIPKYPVPSTLSTLIFDAITHNSHGWDEALQTSKLCPDNNSDTVGYSQIIFIKQLWKKLTPMCSQHYNSNTHIINYDVCYYQRTRGCKDQHFCVFLLYHHYITQLWCMNHFVYVSIQWEMTLHTNIVSHSMGIYTTWSLMMYVI